jgi:hypothetical protein
MSNPGNWHTGIAPSILHFRNKRCIGSLSAIPDELNQSEQAQPSGRDDPGQLINFNRNEEPSGLNALGRRILHGKVIFTDRITPQREKKTRRD